MKVLFGGKFIGTWSQDQGLVYEGKEIQINRGIDPPRRVRSADIADTSRNGVTHAIFGRYVVKAK